DPPRDPRPPLSARHIEVEQDRAPAVLPYHAKLARPAAHGSLGRGRIDRGNNDQDRSQGRKRARYPHLQQGHQGNKSRNEKTRHHRGPIPPRMELHHKAPTAVIVAVIVRRILRTRLAEIGSTVLAGSPGDFGKLIADETKKWAEVIKFSTAKPH